MRGGGATSWKCLSNVRLACFPQTKNKRNFRRFWNYFVKFCYQRPRANFVRRWKVFAPMRSAGQKFNLNVTFSRLSLLCPANIKRCRGQESINYTINYQWNMLIVRGNSLREIAGPADANHSHRSRKYINSSKSVPLIFALFWAGLWGRRVVLWMNLKWEYRISITNFRFLKNNPDSIIRSLSYSKFRFFKVQLSKARLSKGTSDNRIRYKKSYAYLHIPSSSRFMNSF